MATETEEFNRLGEAFYGPNWKTPMAEALGVSFRTLRYWSGGANIPDKAWSKLEALYQGHATFCVSEALPVIASIRAAKTAPKRKA